MIEQVIADGPEMATVLVLNEPIIRGIIIVETAGVPRIYQGIPDIIIGATVEALVIK